MLNKEKWSKEIVELVIEGKGIALVKGVPTSCVSTRCTDCDRKDGNGDCVSFKTWANSEYVEPHSCANCKVDDKVWVRNVDTENWEKRYFAKIEDGVVWCFCSGATSWSNGDVPLMDWKFARPYVEGEEIT